LESQKAIQTALKGAIVKPKRAIENCIFMTKLVISIVKESQGLKRTG
tara:strand:- start:89 stop:229 length:141 start_codon:yes stop_codon:yes gene_type:complete